ncbi:MAG: CHASE domain-containing protein, partial [Angelakisella sp.]
MTERKKNLGIAACLLAISMLVSAFIIHNIKVQSYRQEHERISYITETQASKLQSAIGSLFQKTQTLQMLVIQGGGRVENFDTVAAELLDNSAIRSIQLAPKGVVSQVYPLEGNEEAFGDLFADPARAKEAILARDTGKLTMSGPFELSQGGFGVVGRQPVYLPDQEGKPSFWGFAIIVLDLPDALR